MSGGIPPAAPPEAAPEFSPPGPVQESNAHNPRAAAVLKPFMRHLGRMSVLPPPHLTEEFMPLFPGFGLSAEDRSGGGNT
jgi:hypothetical protein